MAPVNLDRREFVKISAAGTAAVIANPEVGPGSPAPMPERPFGQTGFNVRVFSLGGQATLERSGRRDDAVPIIERALDLGVNYLDTAAAYGRGVSQRYIGEVMATRRKEVFLATKTHRRTRDDSLRLLDESLRLLQTDHLDLWQLHNVRTKEDLDRIFAADGAIHALTQARDEKVVRFLGITGHYDPHVLIDGLSRFDFDTILMALNAADPHHTPFIDTVLPVAQARKLGIIGMKIPARGRMFRTGGVRSMRDAMYYVLTLPVSTIIVGCDTVAQLEENVALARDFRALPREEMQRIENLTRSYASEAAFFKKTGVGWGP